MEKLIAWIAPDDSIVEIWKGVDEYEMKAFNLPGNAHHEFSSRSVDCVGEVAEMLMNCLTPTTGKFECVEDNR